MSVSTDGLHLSSFECLEIGQRSKCTVCKKKRRYFCYDCLQITTPNVDQIPVVALPSNLVIFSHPHEAKSKSTAVHAALLTPNVTFHTYPELPDLSCQGNYLLFPSEDAVPLENLAGEVKTLIVIDATWQKCPGMMLHPFIQKLPRVKINTHTTRFWRIHNKPSTHLSTIEAIYYFFKEYHIIKEGNYNGEYDNLLFFFVFLRKIVENRIENNPTATDALAQRTRNQNKDN